MIRVWRKTGRGSATPDPANDYYGWAHVGDFEDEAAARVAAATYEGVLFLEPISVEYLPPETPDEGGAVLTRIEAQPRYVYTRTGPAVEIVRAKAVT